MANLVRLKQEIQFNSRLGGLLDALKAIAAQQFQSLERKFRPNLPFFEAIQLIAGTFDVEHLAHPFTQTEGPTGVIAVTSDTGLLGGLNQQVILAAVQEYRRSPGQFIVVGERGASYAKEFGISGRGFPSPSEGARSTLADELRDLVLNQVLQGKLSGLTLVYPRALSFTLQRVETIRVLPCAEWFRAGTIPRGVRSGPILLESSVTSLLEYLVWLWLKEKLIDIFAMGRLAELAARSVHLEGSSQELQRRGKKLQLRYFRERHEVIDRSMRELFAAKSLFGKV